MIALGLAIMIVSETATLFRIEPFWSWNTPIAWSGFILFADSLVFRARGNSWLRSAPGEFAWLALLSIPLWLVFEFYNLYIDNCHYVGLPENLWLRLFGYAWSFATIWPAIFVGAELIAVWRRSHASRNGPRDYDGSQSASKTRARHDREPPGRMFWASIVAGVLMLAVPFVTSPGVARYLAAPVWLGFIFLLDPINARLGEESILRDSRRHQFDRIVNLAASGVLCGILWEFWNYWSRAKWHYTVPIMERLKIFEMPVPGYLGFPAFAFECFTMYVFVRWVTRRLLAWRLPHDAGRAIAL